MIKTLEKKTLGEGKEKKIRPPTPFHRPVYSMTE